MAPAAVRTILVDDSPDVRRLLRTRMELEGGYEVLGEAGDGAEAIVLATKHQPDVIVLDAMMPVLSGVDALPSIVKGSPDSKIVVYSAYTDDPALDRIYEAGAHAVVNKAAPVDQLLLAIAGVLPAASA
jgi:DNA-binding NarL/FixJ family response regulator